MAFIKLRGFVLAGMAALLWVAGASAQQAVFDFTKIEVKERARPPKPYTPTPGERIAYGGVCGGISGGPNWRTSLIALDRTSYKLGDEVLFRIRIENPTNRAPRVPRATSIADLEPQNPAADYKYRPYEFRLVFMGQENKHFSVKALTLYASLSSDDSSIELPPGGVIDVVGKTKLVPQVDGYTLRANPPSSEVLQPAEKFRAIAEIYTCKTYRFEAKSQREFAECHAHEFSVPGGSIEVTLERE